MEDSAPLQALLHHCHARKYLGGAVVFRPDDPAETLHYIVSGSVRVAINSQEGGQMVIGYLHKGDFIGEASVFLGPSPRRVLVQTREASTLAEIGYDRLLWLLRGELAEHAADILILLGRHVSRRLVELRDSKLRPLAFQDATARVANCLLELCRQPDAMTHPDGMQLHISRQEIARMVGCSREMAGHIITKLAAEGMISAHGKTIVVFGTRPFSRK